MLKEREIYTATKGVENEGYEFEVGMLAFYCFHLCYHDSINNFKIAIYDDQYHPFDDIVIDISTDITKKYAIQLKHVKDKLLLNSNHFGKNGKMVLSKYFKYDFTKSDHVVLLTNGVVKEEFTVGTCHMKVKTDLTFMEHCLDTSDEEENHIYEVYNEDTSNKFSFFTSQKSRHDIDEAIKSKFWKKFRIEEDNLDGVVQKFKNFFQLWKKGSYKLCKLDKEDIKMKITEILFYEHIADYRPNFGCLPEKKVDLLQKVLNSFNVTILEDVNEDALNNLCCFEFDKKEVIEDGQQLLIIANDHGYKEIDIILWRLKKFPLIIKVDENNEELICQLINDLQGGDLSFVLNGKLQKKDWKVQKVFTNLVDLEGRSHYHEVTQELKLSIQGQNETTLKQLIELNPRFCKIITMKELLLISKGNFTVGDVEEDLPQPYIPRRLITSILKINAVEKFPNDLFAISGSQKLLRNHLPKCKFWPYSQFIEKMTLGASLPPKSIVICDETAKSFATCLKYKNGNVHCLKVIDDEHLQLLYTKEKSESMRQFQVLTEDKLHGILKNNINLVCARPGMGKLTMLKYLRKNCPPGYWTLRVDLQENHPSSYYSPTEDTTFDLKVRRCLKEVRRVIIFFCGIDNLQNDRLIRAAKWIQRLARDDFKTWIFSEDHLRETLEKVFEVPSMEIEEFTEEEQQVYIQERLKDRHVDQGLEKILQSFKMLKNNDILGAPMHLYMLTEIFINDPKANMEEVFVLTDIYKYFIKTKYHHYLKKVSSDHPNQIIDDGIYYRTEQYKLAAVSCLDSTYFNMNIHCDRNFLDQILRIGDVVGIILKISIDRSMIFSQQTYADYFATLWLANNHQKVPNLKNFIFREEFKNILFMFNLEICKNNPAHIAVLYQNYDQIQQSQDKLEEKDPLKRSTLHLACSYGTQLTKLRKDKEEIFKFNSKEIVKEDEEDKRILDFLFEKVSVGPFETDKLFGWTILDYAFNVLNLYAVEKILAKFPESSSVVLAKLDDFKKDLFTIIYFSVKFGHQNLLKLTSKKPDFATTLRMENCNGEHLLYIAVSTGNYQIVSILLDEGADIDTITSTYNKRSALHLAVENRKNHIVKLLLERGASADIMDRYRNTPLHLAASKGVYHSAQLLLKYGSDVNFADNFGRTSLQLAATHGHINVLELLLANGAIIDKSDRCGNTPLSCANAKKHYEVAKILSQQGAATQIRRLSSTEFDEYTSYQLHWVAFTGQAERIEPLIKDGWDINGEDHHKRTPLYRAVTEKHIKLVEMFIDKNADVNIPDENKIMPLCRAISNCDSEMTDLLLRSQAFIDVRDRFNYTPLHWAAMCGKVKIVKLLLSKNPDIDVVDDFGRRPVDCAVENGHYDIVAKFENKDDLLYETAMKRSHFLNHYDNVLKDAKEDSKLTSFEEAVNEGNYSLVKKILRQDKDINKVDFYGFTVLYRAVIKQHEKIVELLLEKGANVNTRDICSCSLLHWAAFNGNLDIVKSLIRHKADVDAVDAFGYSSLEVAVMRGYSEVVDMLVKAGAKVNVVDVCGNSILDWACKKGYIHTVQVLMESGAVGITIQEGYLDMAKKQHYFLKIAKFS